MKYTYVKNSLLDSSNLIHKGFFKENNKEQLNNLLKIKSSKPVVLLKNGDNIYYNAEQFLHGICHIFAYVLHNKFGYDIVEISNESGSTKHWCCTFKHDKNTFYVDVRGITNNFKEVLSAFQPDIGENPSITKISNLSNYSDEWEIEQIKFADEIVEKYIEYYMI